MIFGRKFILKAVGCEKKEFSLMCKITCVYQGINICYVISGSMNEWYLRRNAPVKRILERRQSKTHLFPSMTSIKSSDVASQRNVTSALCIRYSDKIVFTSSTSSSDCATWITNLHDSLTWGFYFPHYLKRFLFFLQHSRLFLTPFSLKCLKWDMHMGIRKGHMK